MYIDLPCQSRDRVSTAKARGSRIGDMNRGRWEFDTVANMSTSGVPQTMRYFSRFLGEGTTLSILADLDEIGGLLSCSDSVGYALLRLLCSEPLTRGEVRLSNVARWGNGSLLAC